MQVHSQCRASLEYDLLEDNKSPTKHKAHSLKNTDSTISAGIGSDERSVAVMKRRVCATPPAESPKRQERPVYSIQTQEPMRNSYAANTRQDKEGNIHKSDESSSTDICSRLCTIL